jgi:NADH-quinone oxidoreductase subunit J
MENMIEIVTAFMIVLSAIGTVSCRNPLYAALWLINCFLFTGVLYVVQDAIFMGFLQVLTYAGAILVLVIFSIMLMDLRDEEGPKGRGIAVQFFAFSSALISVIFLAKFYVEKVEVFAPELDEIPGWGGLQHLGQFLFQEGGLFPFEFITILLLGTLVGCVQLAKRKEWL